MALILAGCESRRAARERAREAYVAGQQQAMAQQRLYQSQRPSVTVEGQVQQHLVPWTEGLTLARAIVAATYTGFMNPSSVRVLRNGQVVQNIPGVDLLRGQDMPLQPGDVVQLNP
ncbi:MAG TPA: hypothetical protein VHB20_06555 [Verrucomicrobiae bacterium]|jgi:hypothetical protein|nr:hypothetical protein [Verrucomicrobiae bacterium]